MGAQYTSKHGIVSRNPFELYMGFVDMNNFARMVPSQAKEQIENIEATFDTLDLTVRGFHIGIKVAERIPYSKIVFTDNGAPFEFAMSAHFDAVSGDPSKTDFHVEVAADLNLMMKMMLGPKLQGALDQLVDGLVGASEGHMPDMNFPQ